MTEPLYTIGHSTHPIEKFISLLKSQNIEVLVDIRTIPKSRHNPQYEQSALKAELEKNDIAYEYMKELGGLRKPDVNSSNRGWRNTSFRGYADYMRTRPFQKSLGALIATGKKKRTAMMCAESVPWRCHRSLVADALYARDIPVFHIMPDGRASAHKLTSFAHIEGVEVTYPPENPTLPGL